MNRAVRFCACLILLFALADAATAEPKRVLLMHSFGPQFVPWVFFSAQFREELIKQSPDKIDLYEVSLESARFKQPQEQGPFIDYLRSLFAERKLDLIVTLGAPATFFVQHYRSQFFPSTPMLIGAPELRAINTAALTEQDTTVAVTLDFAKWVENILQVLPSTNHIAWAVGASPLERFWTEEIRRTTQQFAGRVTFEWFNDLSFEDMLKRVAVLPPNSAVFYVDLRVDAAGVPLDRDRVLGRLHQASNAPIFSYIDSYLGQGIVGGPLLSSAELGRRMASVSIRILAGEQPSNIKTPALAMAAPAYDWRELQRWQISEKSLPPGSQIRFREPGILERYWAQIVAVCVALLVQSALIIWLVYEYRRRHRAEIQSRESMAELTQINRLATAGELSASITHEVKQPLAVMVAGANAALRWLSRESPDVGEARDALQNIVSAGHRASDIVTNIRAMFGRDTEDRVPTDINKLIWTVAGLVYIDMRKHSIESQIVLSEQLPPVLGNEVQLQQVILNLMMNAIESMTSEETRVLSVKSEATGKDTVHISIADTGSGIDIANLNRIFKPMFTTKARGMGMGLSICKSIIESHGGRIWASAGIPKGSVFHFELPVYRGDKDKSALSDATRATSDDRLTPSAASNRSSASEMIE